MFDPQRFKDLFLPFHGHLYRTAYRLLNNGSHAEDVVQDVFVKLWSMRDKLGTVKNLEAYATTVTRNLCLDILRSGAYKASLNGVSVSELSTAGTSTEYMDHKDSLHQIVKLVETLPERQKELFKMRYFNELSLEEIRQLTGLNPVNIRVQLSRALKNVKEQFEKQNSHEKK
ncbi:MAG: sigma-70 family RNA polymerase sigma factor [Bacteroidales bacterium]|nr:sigma-70 family RNA polymerase sigma factor [Bacteroidales bacterium]